MRQLAPALLTLGLLGCGVQTTGDRATRTAKAVERTRQALSTSVVISEVYGGSGSNNSVIRHDFVELFNLGSTAVNLSGWSVQYASDTGGTWNPTPLMGMIQPGQYYLVQLGTQGSGMPLPTPDATGTVFMSATAGKVALVNGTAPLTGTCPAASRYVDLVGYGSANCSEGMPTARPSATASARRNGNGCVESDNNLNDFTVGTPTPRNSGSPGINCANQDAGVIITPPTDGGCLTIRGWPSGKTTAGYDNDVATVEQETLPGPDGGSDAFIFEVVFGSGLTVPVTRQFQPGDTFGACDVCVRIYRGCDSMGACTESYLAQGGSATVSNVIQDSSAGRIEATLPNVTLLPWDFENDEPDTTVAGCIQLNGISINTAWDADAGRPMGGGSAGGAATAGGRAGGSAGGSTGGGSAGGSAVTAGGPALADAGSPDGGTGTMRKGPCGCSADGDSMLGHLVAVGLLIVLTRRRALP